MQIRHGLAEPHPGEDSSGGYLARQNVKLIVAITVMPCTAPSATKGL